MKRIDVTITFALTNVPDTAKVDEVQAAICKHAEAMKTAIYDGANNPPEQQMGDTISVDGLSVATIETTVKRYVNAYSVSRRYGGPEEGGWWYDEGMPLKSVEANGGDEVVEALKQALWVEFGPTMGFDPDTRQRVEGRSRSSVIGDDDLEIREEDHPATNYPDRRPHYE